MKSGRLVFRTSIGIGGRDRREVLASRSEEGGGGGGEISVTDGVWLSGFILAEELSH